MDGWRIEILRQIDGEWSQVEQPNELPIVPCVGDDLPCESNTGTAWARVVGRRFRWDELGQTGSIQLLIKFPEQ